MGHSSLVIRKRSPCRKAQFVGCLFPDEQRYRYTIRASLPQPKDEKILEMNKSIIIPAEIIERKIFLIRGRKVMLSTHLAELYDVEVRALIQAVKRNAIRIPSDFMSQLTRHEYSNLKSQIVISRDEDKVYQ